MPNIASNDLVFANAFTNNTFDIDQTHNTIKSTIENSFNYLGELQKAYIPIYRFNFTNDDALSTSDGKIFISISKDIINVNARKVFKQSNYYGKEISIVDAMNTSGIYTILPLVLVNGKSTFDYTIRMILSGNLEIKFNDYSTETFFDTEHNFEIILLNIEWYKEVKLNKYVINNYNYILPPGISELTDRSNIVMAFISKSTLSEGSNFIKCKFTEYGELDLRDLSDDIKNMINDTPSVSFKFISIPYLYEVNNTKEIFTRSDNGNKIAISVIRSDDGNLHKMQIPSKNILLFKQNDLTGELTYVNNANITSHYPNIYEIIDNNENIDYSYKLFYFYYSPEEKFQFTNIYKYYHRYLERKYDGTLEESICKILKNSNDIDAEAYKYFLKVFNYTDYIYEYSNDDFFKKMHPYNFDYKIATLKNFIHINPNTLKEYAKDLYHPGETFFLYVKNLNLNERLRKNNRREASASSDIVEFDEDRYMFAFQNEFNCLLDLRFFIDGILCTDVYTFIANDMEYIYIPVKYITANSYIEIEKFNRYAFKFQKTFTSADNECILSFEGTEPIRPTLFDLYFTDDNGKRLDRSKFKIYSRIPDGDFDISDLINSESKIVTYDANENKVKYIALEDMVEIDPNTGEYFIDMSDGFYLDENGIPYILLSSDIKEDAGEDPGERLPIKYMYLNKIKIRPINIDDFENVSINIIVNKIPYMATYVATKNEIPRVYIENGKVDWNQKSQYIRMFINGRMIPCSTAISENPYGQSIVDASVVANAGETVTVDITPYAYECEYNLNAIPEDFVIDLGGKLSKPFDLDYYDIYVNGRKLNETNVVTLSASKIAFINMKSRKNLYIYKKDRDYEYYGVDIHIPDSIDETLSQDSISNKDKEGIIKDIIHDTVPDGVYPGTNKDTEPDINDQTLDKIMNQIYRFYMDRILPANHIEPDENQINNDDIDKNFPVISEKYLKTNTVLINPDINSNASVALLVGLNESKTAF